MAMMVRWHFDIEAVTDRLRTTIPWPTRRLFPPLFSLSQAPHEGLILGAEPSCVEVDVSYNVDLLGSNTVMACQRLLGSREAFLQIYHVSEATMGTGVMIGSECGCKVHINKKFRPGLLYHSFPFLSRSWSVIMAFESVPQGVVPPSITNFTAPLLFGAIFTAFLFGILTVQLYVYHTNFADDKPRLKVFVYGVYIFELLTVLLIIVDAYKWLAQGFGDRQALDRIEFGLINSAVLGSFMALTVHGFYCHRIWVLNRKAWPIACGIFLLALGVTATSTYAGINGTMLGRFSALPQAGKAHKITTLVSLVGVAAVDVLITLSTSILLLRGRRDLRPQSRFLIKRILILTVETNFLSSSIAVLLVILLTSVPFPWHTCPAVVLSRTYSNSLLLLLNNRKQARKRLNQSTMMSSVSGLASPNGNAMKRFTVQQAAPKWEVSETILSESTREEEGLESKPHTTRASSSLTYAV